jgi:hypothetical protein
VPSRDLVTPGWKSVGVVYEGDDIEVAGVNPWNLTWANSGAVITVAHPSYPDQRHQAQIWRFVENEQSGIVFAAGELSNLVWGFWIPSP